MEDAGKKYRIHWVGYPADQDQWVSDLDVTDVLVEDYDRKCRERHARTTSAALRALDDEAPARARTLLRMVEPDMIRSDSTTPSPMRSGFRGKGRTGNGLYSIYHGTPRTSRGTTSPPRGNSPAWYGHSSRSGTCWRGQTLRS